MHDHRRSTFHPSEQQNAHNYTQKMLSRPSTSVTRKAPVLMSAWATAQRPGAGMPTLLPASVTSEEVEESADDGGGDDGISGRRCTATRKLCERLSNRCSSTTVAGLMIRVTSRRNLVPPGAIARGEEGTVNDSQ